MLCVPISTKFFWGSPPHAHFEDSMWKVLLRSLLLGLLTAGLLLAAIPSLRSTSIKVRTTDIPANIEGIQVSFNYAVRRAGPAVVHIYNRQYREDDRTQLNAEGLGFGVIVSEKGYIITNYHLIEKSDQIIVALQDGRYAAAQLVGKDRRTDIAILRIEGTNLPVIPQNSNYQAKVGDIVLAIGNPYNLGQTTTFGIISATRRSSISSDHQQPFIQTDAAINKGNSGGALVNTNGELVGINTASFQHTRDIDTNGISFAIPYSLAKVIMEKIIADGRVIRGYIGIDGRDINNAVSSRILSGDYVGGIIVLNVDPNGPADKAGVKPQDVILKIGEAQLTGRDSVLEIVTSLRPGTEVAMTVLRNGKEKILNVMVGDDPQE